MYTGVSYLPWQADTGQIVLVKLYYSDQAADTIVSPTDIVINNISNYEGPLLLQMNYGSTKTMWVQKTMMFGLHML